MTDWSAAQYLMFERERTRPARDLLSAVPLADARVVVDLGCGPGNSTALLVERFPQAAVTGVDTSPDMLGKARGVCPQANFVESDLVTWEPDAAPDLLFANAVLQWVPDHAVLLPRLMSFLAPGGVLAVQMPDNLDEASHAQMRAIAAKPSFAPKLARAAEARTILPSFETYYAWMRPHADVVDMWRTTYVHALDGAPAIVEWVKGTGLRPFLQPLDAKEQERYVADYTRALEQAYPHQADGKSLLRFPRFFLIAVRP